MDRRPGARLGAHLALLLCAGCFSYWLTALALLVLDGHCVMHPAHDGCSPIRLHLNQFLPLYATAAALLLGCGAGVTRLIRHEPIDPVIRLIWSILGAAVALAVVLR